MQDKAVLVVKKVEKMGEGIGTMAKGTWNRDWDQIKEGAGKFANNTLGLFEASGELFLKVNPHIRMTVDTLNDQAKRAIALVKGEMNFDIVNNGPQLSGVRDLLPGDILLKQGNWKDEVVAGIGSGQILLNRANHNYFVAGLLGHAAVYIGEGKVVESAGKGVRIMPLTEKEGNEDYRKYNWYVISAKDSQICNKIAEEVKTLVDKADYNHDGLIGATLGMDVAIDVTQRVRNMLDNNKRPVLFCSELAAYGCNRAADAVLGTGNRFFSKNQNQISPEELYAGLRDNKQHFIYKGELHSPP